MKIFNKDNSKNTGTLEILTSFMLISPQNSPAKHISIQVSEVPAGSAQPVHSHAPEQCYYIIKGKGLMILGDETQEVKAGDAVFIPSNINHGIKNTGDGVLEYLTVNSPVFEKTYEDKLWPGEPGKR